MEDYYHLNYTVVSLVFLSPFAGYTFAAVVNNLVHVRFGQRGIAIVGPACHLVSYIILAVHPPYPVLVVIYIFVGFGQGLVDAAWCAWLGNMANANEVAGFLHCCYALGATVAPLIATGMFSGGGLPWYSFFYVMVCDLKCSDNNMSLIICRSGVRRLNSFHLQRLSGHRQAKSIERRIQVSQATNPAVRVRL